MFVINLHLAHRLLPCVSTEETRYYLNGVGVHLLEHGARLIATDGCILGVFRDHEAHGTHDGIAIVSRLAIADAFKAARKEARRNDPSSYWLVVDDTGMGSAVLAPTASDAVAGRDDGEAKCPILWRSARSVLIDGSFPDYTHAIPQEAHHVAPCDCGFNPALIGRFASIINDAKDATRGVSLISTCAKGDGPYLVLSAFVPDFVGVVMPMRNGTVDAATLVATARDVLDRPAAALEFITAKGAERVDA